MLTRYLALIYAGIAYLAGIVSIAYIAGFLLDFGVPKGITDGPAGPWRLAVAVDLCLIVMFCSLHSLTARRSFKRWWLHVVPQHIERATYLYMTAATTWLLVALWRPIPQAVWQIDNPIGAASVVAASALVWTMMFAATFHFDHLSFLGIRQALDHYRQRQPSGTRFTARFLYSLVRHPISLGWMLVPWLTPRLSVGQLMFALSVTAYILIATRYEERDLVAELGSEYKDYRTRVPAFLPVPGRTADKRV